MILLQFCDSKYIKLKKPIWVMSIVNKNKILRYPNDKKVKFRNKLKTEKGVLEK